MQLLIKSLSLLILMLYFKEGMTQAIINIFDLCTCEQLLYQAECEQFPSCKFSNNICESLQCSEIPTQKSCNFNRNCAWLNNQCSDFYSCSYYNLTNETQCHQLNEECQFNPFTNVCDRYDKAFTKQCSETTKEECFYGSDGICKYQDGKCSKLTSCGSVTQDDYSCYLAQPACYCNSQTQICENGIGCKNSKSSSCKVAAAKIDDMASYYLCQKPSQSELCQDLNPEALTQENCFSDSLGYYHWNGNFCEACTGSKSAILLLANLIAMLII